VVKAIFTFGGQQDGFPPPEFKPRLAQINYVSLERGDVSATEYDIIWKGEK
jgi:hypothetical protein